MILLWPIRRYKHTFNKRDVKKSDEFDFSFIKQGIYTIFLYIYREIKVRDREASQLLKFFIKVKLYRELKMLKKEKKTFSQHLDFCYVMKQINKNKLGE